MLLKLDKFSQIFRAWLKQPQPVYIKDIYESARQKIVKIPQE